MGSSPRLDNLSGLPLGSQAWGLELTQGSAGQVIQAKVLQMAIALGLSADDQEDLAQILRTELYRRAVHYDPARGTWGQFSVTVVKRCASDLARYPRWKLWRSREPRVSPLTKHSAERRGPLRSEESPPHNVVDARIDYTKAEFEFSAAEQEMVVALLEGSLRAAARKLGIPLSTLRDRLSRLRQRLRHRGFQDYCT